MSLARELRWKAVERFIHSDWARWMLTSDRGLAILEAAGFYIIPNHFYSPIYDYAGLRRNDRVFGKKFSFGAVGLNEDRQLALLNDLRDNFRQEIEFPLDPSDDPTAYHIRNDQFGRTSAAMLHYMVRKFKPQTIMEVGSGFSTLVSVRASRVNRAEGREASIVSIEPYPRPFLKRMPEIHLIRTKVEDVDLNEFLQLNENDILFIDSSHVVRTGGDVNFLYLEVLPLLKPGVLIHVHDIFFPKDYPRDWVVGLRRFWTEQYLLHAFLLFNKEFEVLWCGSLMYERHLSALRQSLPLVSGLGERDNYFSSSFWMRRVTPPVNVAPV